MIHSMVSIILQKENGLDKLKENVVAWLQNYLLSNGYSVKRNTMLEGDGVKHVFDLMAETYPLPGSRVRIGIIISIEKINLDYIERLIGWLNEIKSLKIVLVPLAGVDAKAHILAMKYGIDIVTLPREVLKTLYSGKSIKVHLNKYYVKPVVEKEKIIKKVLERTKPSIFRSPKCLFEKIALTYYPFIEYEIEVPRISTERGEAEVVEGKLVIDGIYGYLVIYSGEDFKIMREYGSLSEIPDEAHEILKILSEENSIELGALSARLKMDQYTLKSLLLELSMHGFIDIYGDLIEFKQLNTKLFLDLDSLLNRHNGELIEGEPVLDEEFIRLDEKIPLFRIEDLISSLGAKTISVKIIYYPLYTALMQELRGELKRDKILVFDGLAGNELNDLSINLTTPEFIDRVKTVKGIMDIDADGNCK